MSNNEEFYLKEHISECGRHILNNAKADNI